MKKRKKENFEIIFKKLESKNNREILQITRDVKAIVDHVENQEEEFEKISAISFDTQQMYFSTST